jgi:hypothetical protein
MNSVVELPSLSPELDTFALAVIEYGGNLGAAYKAAFPDDKTPVPVSRARELITRADVAKRIQELTVATEEHALISLGSHLVHLAQIRDLAIDNKQLKVALDAEKSRGEVAGFYGSSPKGPSQPSPTGPMVQINLGPGHANVTEWSAKHGKTPLVINAQP